MRCGRLQLGYIIEGDHKTDDILFGVALRAMRTWSVRTPSPVSTLISSSTIGSGPPRRVRQARRIPALKPLSGRPMISSSRTPSNSIAGGIGQIYAPGPVQTYPPGRDTGQHGFGKPSTILKLTIGFCQFTALSVELPRHPVERPGQHPDSSSDRDASSNRTLRFPERTISVACTRFAICRDRRLAKPSPTPTAVNSNRSVTMTKIAASSSSSRDRLVSA